MRNAKPAIVMIPAVALQPQCLKKSSLQSSQVSVVRRACSFEDRKMQSHKYCHTFLFSSPLEWVSRYSTKTLCPRLRPISRLTDDSVIMASLANSLLKLRKVSRHPKARTRPTQMASQVTYKSPAGASSWPSGAVSRYFRCAGSSQCVRAVPDDCARRWSKARTRPTHRPSQVAWKIGAGASLR
jgi:hypothetical protein